MEPLLQLTVYSLWMVSQALLSMQHQAVQNQAQPYSQPRHAQYQCQLFEVLITMHLDNSSKQNLKLKIVSAGLKFQILA